MNRIRLYWNQIFEWWGRQRGADRFMITFQGIVAGATISYVVVALFQWSALKNTLIQTTRLADNAETELKYSERAWLGVAVINITQQLASNQAMKLEVPFENSGKSPALHVLNRMVLKPERTFFRTEFEVPLSYDPAIADCYKPKPKWSGDLGGEIVLPGSIGMISHLTSQVFDDDDLSDLAHATPTPQATPSQAAHLPDASPTLAPMPHLGELNLFLVGCVDYFDEFHVVHRTQFCEYYSPGPPPVFAFCPKGNSAD